MSGIAPASLQKTFALDPDILGANSAASLELSGTTDADVVIAVARNEPFPARPSGVIDLTHISLGAAGGNPVAFQGAGATLGFGFSAGVTAGAAIFDRAQDAIGALGLNETPGLDLTIRPDPDSRYCLLRSSYQASGSVTGAHPIGTVGSFTFGASAASTGLSAVLHRFPKDAGADTVLQETIHSWKLPLHVNLADKLAPQTWIITEASGSLAVKLGASLGYNFNFVRQASEFGLSGDIGLKIDAAATATFGFEVSGRYLVVAGRESGDQKLRLLLFKLSSNGMQFGLNLKIGLTGVETVTPDKADAFVKAVFGVHGAQIVNVLGQIEKWTDPRQSVGQLVAGLVNDKALALLKDVTGIDPDTAFDAARGKLLDAIHLYQSLPDKVSSELLDVLNQFDASSVTSLRNVLASLAQDEPNDQEQAFKDLLKSPGITESPVWPLLSALADKGLLNLLDRLPEVRTIAKTVLSILNGEVIANLQKYVNDALDLGKILKVVQQTDFDKLDSFLVGRLSKFFDKTLGFADLDEIKNAINMVILKRQQVYDKIQTALNSRYGLDAAATWQRTSANTAVVDAVFDFSDPMALNLFKGVVTGADSALDQLLTTELPSVHRNVAVLSHELTRKTTLEVSLPLFNFRTESVTTAFGKVTAEDDSGRILLYEASGTGTVGVRNKFKSSLTVTIAAAIAHAGSAASFPDLRIHSTDGNTWSYRLLYTKAGMKREELEAITRPFLTQYMAGQFAQTSLSTWYNELERTSEGVLHNGPEVYGDVCAAFEVTLPGETLTAWMAPVSNISAVAKQISLAIQRELKTQLLFFYFNDIGKLRDLEASAPLLAWASIPPAFAFDGSSFNSASGNQVFWDHVDPTLRKQAVHHQQTASRLLARLPALRLRLEEAGLHRFVQFYRDDQVGNLLTSATGQFGDNLMRSLLLCEAEIVEKAKDAFSKIQAFLPIAGNQPSRAKDLLAEFAFDIATAFNKLIGNSVFADRAFFRGVAQVVFGEASRALNSSLVVQPRAMLTLNILKTAPPRTFPLSAFLEGKLPQSAEIAVAQRLVGA